MANFTAGTSFTDGVTNDVTAAKLNALVADAVPTSNLALASTTGTISNFTSSTANITLGTIPTLTAGTTTGTAGIFTSGTITTGVIPTGTFGTTTSTAATIATGTIPTLTTGTTTSTNEVVTNGTITNLSATTSTFLGAITASTAVINVGSGQIYKDSSGRVGIGATSPDASYKMTISGSRSGVASGIIFTDSDATPTNYGLYINGNKGFTIYDATAGVNRLLVDSSGNVGVGTASPSQKLDVYGGVVARGTLFLGDGSSSVIRKLTASTPLTFANQAGSAEMTIDASGGVTIAGLAGSGSRAVNASAAGLLSAASDSSLKEEVVGAHIAGLAEILQIHPKMYRWKDDIANRGDQASVELGFIANDVAPIIPSAAPMGNDGLYGFYDRSITAALVKAVQELSAKVTALESA